ncbi:MAG: hypothetical protein Q7J98_03335, partial [Kiritimatiellia bacterium]|nr:hypothetical protein [Kiritimatiellia bacterium]
MRKYLFKKTLFLSFLPIIGLLAFSGCERPEIKKMEKSKMEQPKVAKPLPSRKISWAPWNKEITGRTPLVERTLVFPRAQLKYGLDGNYLHFWVDRPLLCDRSLRLDEQKWNNTTYSSYRRMMEVLKDLYEVDGLGFLAETGGRINVVKQTDRANVEGFYLLPALGWKSSVTPTQDDVLKTVLASKSALRINGKIPIPIYGRHVEPGKWKPFLEELRAKYADKFLFLVAIYCPPEKGSWSEYIKKFLSNNNSLPPEDLETIKEYWRSYLDVADGVYHGEVIYSGEEGLYGPDRKYCGEFHQKVIAPILVELLSDPKYKTKYLFCSAGVGYFRPGPGVCRSEDGTKTLRQSFDGAMASNPDVIVMAEWDEQNENTCVRPTVYNSFSTQRIIKYYMRRLKGEKPAPNPGDDLSLPNLIVSYRKILSLGEPLEVELLNVPDSVKDDFYSVTLTLRDLNGAPVKSFPARSFLMNELKDHTLVIPSEELAGHLVLIPSLEITDSQGQKRIFQEGLHHILLRATWNWDYKWVKQPLRDICWPTKASFAFTATPDVKDSEKTGTVGKNVAGVFECDEKIASVEIVEDGDEVYAVDPDNEYGRDGDNILLCIEWRSWLGGREWGTAGKNIRGTLTVQNSDIKRVGTLVIKPDQYTVAENSIELKAYVSDWKRKIFIAIPEKDKEKAVLDFDVDVFPKGAKDSTPPIGKIKFNVPVKRIMAGNGVYAKTYDGGMNITISKYDKLPDHPFHIGEKSISFNTTIYPETPTSVFQMRVITKSGKIYW